MNHLEYSVCQFFPDGSYEYVRRFVSAEEAVGAFVFYTKNVSAKSGFTNRVIITDGDDLINAEWINGKYVYPDSAMVLDLIECVKTNQNGLSA